MALSKSDLLFVAKLSDSSFGNAELLHQAGVKAVAKAYATGNGEFGQACCDALRVAERVELARFLRKHGLNVTIDRTRVTVGGPINSKSADRHIRAAKADIAFFKLVDAHIKTRQSKPKAEPQGTIAERADQAIRRFITRIQDEDVRTAVNERLQKPSWYEKLAELCLSDEEVDMVIEAVLEYRLAARMAA